MAQKNPDEITVDRARLDDLEHDVRTAIHDSRNGDGVEPVNMRYAPSVEGLIVEIVKDSDFVPEDEQAIVALEMYRRIVEDGGDA